MIKYKNSRKPYSKLEINSLKAINLAHSLYEIAETIVKISDIIYRNPFSIVDKLYNMDRITIKDRNAIIKKLTEGGLGGKQKPGELRWTELNPPEVEETISFKISEAAKYGADTLAVINKNLEEIKQTLNLQNQKLDEIAAVKKSRFNFKQRWQSMKMFLWFLVFMIFFIGVIILLVLLISGSIVF